MNRTLAIQGRITLLSPMHISMPGVARFDPTRNSVRIGDTSKGGHACTLTRSLGIFSDESVYRVPVIPANGWRGRLRRGAASVIESHIMGREERLSFDVYQSMHSGAITGSLDGTTVRLDEARAIREHVFLGLFGGGSRMAPSCLKVANGYPILPAMIESGVIPERAADDVMPIPMGDVWRKLFDYIPLPRVDDIAQMRDASASEKIDPDELKQRMLDEIERRASKKTRKSSDEVGDEDRGDPALQFMTYSEVVTTGTRFWQQLSMTGTEAQAGLLLLALEKVMSQPVGGKSAIGNGQIACRMMATLDGEFVGEILSAANGLDYGNEHVKELVKAAEDEIKELSAASLAELFRSTKPAKKSDEKSNEDD